MLKALLLSSALIAATPVWASGTADGVASAPSTDAEDQGARALTPEERAQAVQELHELQARMTRLENMLGVPNALPTPVPPPERKAKSDHNLELYGFVQLDAIQDFDRVNPNWDATLRPSRIATTKGQFGSDGQSIFSAKQSRLGVKATGTLAGRPYEAKFEFDMFGVGADEGQFTFRPRHYYISWGPFLAGQTNSVFMDADEFPNVVDYWGPAGMVFLRTPQIRWTFWDRDGWKAAVALEHVSNDIDKGNLRLIDEELASAITNDEKMPDLTAQVRYGGKWGHVQLSGILRRLGYDTPGTVDNEPKGHRTGWGVNLGSSFNVSLATLRLGATYGRGIASYMNDGGMDFGPNVAVIQQPGQLVLVPSAEAVKLFGMTSYVDLSWSKEWTSSVGYSFDQVHNTNFQTPTAFHKGQYASANLLWHPAPNLFTGGELLWGRRTDNDGNSGKDLRFQFTAHYDFSSNNIWDMFE